MNINVTIKHRKKKRALKMLCSALEYTQLVFFFLLVEAAILVPWMRTEATQSEHKGVENKMV